MSRPPPFRRTSGTCWMAETRLHREQCGLIERCIRACTAAARRGAILAPPMLSIRLSCHEPATRRIFMRSRRRDTRADTREPDLWGRLQSLARKLTTVGYDDPARVGQSVPASFEQIRALGASWLVEFVARWAARFARGRFVLIGPRGCRRNYWRRRKCVSG